MSNRPEIAFLAGPLRVEEKMLLEAYSRRGVEPVRIDVRRMSIDLDQGTCPPGLEGVRVIHDRGLSYGASLHIGTALDAAGFQVVNSPDVVRTCGDKLVTSARLFAAGVPQPRTRAAFTPEQALEVLESDLGYPAVLKPVVGSWGRLVARLNDRDAAEAVLADRHTLGGWTHHTHYLQEFIEKPGRDLRVFVVGDEPVAAIRRESDHWITNTARGAKTSAAQIDDSLGELALRAARAVGGGVLAVDIVEDPERGYLVLEVNHSMEFRNSIEPTGVDIPGAIVDHMLGLASGFALSAQTQGREAL